MMFVDYVDTSFSTQNHWWKTLDLEITELRSSRLQGIQGNCHLCIFQQQHAFSAHWCFHIYTCSNSYQIGSLELPEYAVQQGSACKCTQSLKYKYIQQFNLGYDFQGSKLWLRHSVCCSCVFRSICSTIVGLNVSRCKGLMTSGFWCAWIFLVLQFTHHINICFQYQSSSSVINMKWWEADSGKSLHVNSSSHPSWALCLQSIRSNILWHTENPPLRRLLSALLL